MVLPRGVEKLDQEQTKWRVLRINKGARLELNLAQIQI